MKTLLFIFVASICSMAQFPFHSPETKKTSTPWNNLNFNAKEGQFQFAIVSDRTGGHRPGVFEDGVKKLNLLQPEFVLSVGDLIEGYTTDTATIIKEWEEFDGFISKLQMPFFYVPGNHDFTNEVQRDIWHKRYGADHYYFIYQDVLFLCLNSEDNMRGSGKGTIGDAQYQWVQEVLKKNQKVKWTLVFMHQPMWDQGNDPIRWFDVEKLLADRKHTVFVGHRHRYVAYERNKSNYYILATTGGGSPLRGPQLGEFDHLVWITMTEEGPIMANLALDGIYNDQFMNWDMKDFSSKVLNSKMVELLPLKVSDENFETVTAKVILRNDLNVPVTYKMQMGFSWDLKADLEKGEVVLQPNSREELNVYISSRRTKALEEIQAVKLRVNLEIPAHEKIPNMEIPFVLDIKPE